MFSSSTIPPCHWSLDFFAEDHSNAPQAHPRSMMDSLPAIEPTNYSFNIPTPASCVLRFYSSISKPSGAAASALTAHGLSGIGGGGRRHHLSTPAGTGMPLYIPRSLLTPASTILAYTRIHSDSLVDAACEYATHYFPSGFVCHCDKNPGAFRTLMTVSAAAAISNREIKEKESS